tara:strand:- start:1678 stop:2640 length:963 start_codon:yes stop_codon:yes gene_type:complete
MYICKTCDYSTDVKCNFRKHLQTKKHKKLIKQNIYDSPMEPELHSGGVKTDPAGVIYECKYCNMVCIRRSNLTTHLKKCKYKLLFDYKLKNDALQTELTRVNNQKDKVLNEYEEKIKKLTDENNELRKLKDEIQELREENKYINRSVLKIAENQSNISKKQVTNNTQFIINNFTNAPNLKFPDIKWTDSDIKKYIEMGSVKGLSKIITDCWVDNIKPENRSIWNVDYARNKYLIRIEDAWMVDVDGTKFQELTIDKIYDIFMNYMKSSDQDSTELLEIMEFICDIKNKNMAMKVMKEAGKYLIYDNEKYKDEDLEKFVGI